MAFDQVLGAREAREKFADLLGRVHYRGETVIIERSGKPMVAVIPIELYESMIAERKARFEVVDRLREKAPTVSEDEVMDDVAEAIAAIRAAR